MKKLDNYLVISDAHLPFEHRLALKFCKELKKDFCVPNENVFNVGDFDDQYWASSHAKSPDARFTSNQELEIVKEKMILWGEAFPQMKICTSNHSGRYYKRLFEAELPSQILRKLEEILGYPPGWQVKEHFIVFANHDPFCIQHGEGFAGPLGHRDAAIANGMSTIIGHLHSNAGINFIKTAHQDLWSMNIGCLVDNESYAFEYGKHSKFKPTIGCGIVLDGGRFPLWIPLK